MDGVAPPAGRTAVRAERNLLAVPQAAQMDGARTLAGPDKAALVAPIFRLPAQAAARPPSLILACVRDIAPAVRSGTWPYPGLCRPAAGDLNANLDHHWTYVYIACEQQCPHLRALPGAVPWLCAPAAPPVLQLPWPRAAAWCAKLCTVHRQALGCRQCLINQQTLSGVQWAIASPLELPRLRPGCSTAQQQVWHRTQQSIAARR